jgi:hypothetical protein
MVRKLSLNTLLELNFSEVEYETSLNKYNNISGESLRHFSLMNCFIENVHIQNNNLVLFLDHIDVLPIHPMNPYKVPKQTDQSYIQFHNFKIIKLSQIINILDDNGNLDEGEEEYKEIEITTFEQEDLQSFINNTSIYVFERNTDNDCVLYVYSDEGGSLKIEIQYQATKIGWNEFTNDSWLVRSENCQYHSTIFNEKTRMNRIRYIYNYYILIPVILIFIIGLVILTYLTDNDAVFIIAFALFGIVLTSLMVAMYFIRKKEIKLECAKYNFDVLKVPNYDEYEFVAHKENVKIILNENGILIDEQNFFKYDQFDIRLSAISNHFLVFINLEFNSNDITELNGLYFLEYSFSIPLNKELVYAINKFNINITNKNDLDYIINNKERSFKILMKYGQLMTFRDFLKFLI